MAWIFEIGMVTKCARQGLGRCSPPVYGHQHVQTLPTVKIDRVRTRVGARGHVTATVDTRCYTIVSVRFVKVTLLPVTDFLARVPGNRAIQRVHFVTINIILTSSRGSRSCPSSSPPLSLARSRTLSVLCAPLSTRPHGFQIRILVRPSPTTQCVYLGFFRLINIIIVEWFRFNCFSLDFSCRK
jgi:hypothetical protein